jgi:hypothetical protein
LFNKEPAVVLGALAEVIKAVIPAFIIFGLLDWTSEQVAAVMFVVSVSVSSLSVILTRSNTVPTQTAVNKETANAQIETALRLPSSASVKDVIRITEAQ